MSGNLFLNNKEAPKQCYVVFVDGWLGPALTTSAFDSVIVLGLDLQKSWLLCYRNKRAKTLRVPFNGTAI